MKKEELLKKLNKTDPKDYLISSDSQKYLIFERMSMDGLEEMHSYSTDTRLYEHLEFDAFEDIHETREYILKLLKRVEQGHAAYWFVRRKMDNKLIGTAGLLRLEFDNQSIEWGFGIDPELWGEGYILQIMESLKLYVFEELELNRLYGQTFITNEQTISSIKATGMRGDGILKDFYYKNGQYIDAWSYSMFKSEYFSKQDNPISKKKTKFDEKSIIDIISNVLASKDINFDSNISNTKKWDSLNHMAIMIELSKKSKIHFNPKQIASATSVKIILDILNSKKN